MGISEEAGKAAGDIISSLKSYPLILSLVLMNLGLLGLMYVIAGKSSETRQREFTMIFDNQKEMMELIAKCSPRP